MSGSGTNRIADYGDGGFQILFFSLFAALSELYSQVDMSQWVDIFFEEAYLNLWICVFTRYFWTIVNLSRKIYHNEQMHKNMNAPSEKNVTPIVPVL